MFSQSPGDELCSGLSLPGSTGPLAAPGHSPRGVVPGAPLLHTDDSKSRSLSYRPRDVRLWFQRDCCLQLTPCVLQMPSGLVSGWCWCLLCREHAEGPSVCTPRGPSACTQRGPVCARRGAQCAHTEGPSLCMQRGPVCARPEGPVCACRGAQCVHAQRSPVCTRRGAQCGHTQRAFLPRGMPAFPWVPTNSLGVRSLPVSSAS